MTIKIGPIQKKILLLLQAGVSLVLASTPQRQLKVVKELLREWQFLNNRQVKDAIKNLYRSKLIKYREYGDGKIEVMLSRAGQERGRMYDLEKLSIPRPNRWDKKWRVIIFDIPENLKKAREAIRSHLRRLGFYQLQKSVFVLPYECSDEIELLIEVYDLQRYVRQLIVASIDNELHLKQIFNIT